jgi:hypothetical protein
MTRAHTTALRKRYADAPGVAEGRFSTRKRVSDLTPAERGVRQDARENLACGPESVHLRLQAGVRDPVCRHQVRQADHVIDLELVQ